MKIIVKELVIETSEANKELYTEREIQTLKQHHFDAIRKLQGEHRNETNRLKAQHDKETKEIRNEIIKEIQENYSNLNRG